MTVLITLTVAGADSGPFNLYSDIDGFTSAFETGVSKAALLAGYSSSAVPDYTSIIRVLSTGDCTNYIDIVLDAPPTSSTTTTAPTTTTTTTLTCSQYILSVADVSGESASVEYLNCAGVLEDQTIYWGSSISFCASIITAENLGPYGSLSLIGPCPP
jgi:hypothetical protein